MEKDNFIKIDRGIINWKWFHKKDHLKTWLVILSIAAQEETQYENVTLRPGELVGGRDRLARLVGCSPDAMKTILRNLQATHEICRRRTGNLSIISITNWHDYVSCRRRSAAVSPLFGQRSAAVSPPEKAKIEVKSKPPTVNSAKLLAQIREVWNTELSHKPYTPLFFSRSVQEAFNTSEGYLPTLEEWKGLISKIKASRWLSEKQNITFSWMVNPDNVCKVLEGKYDNQQDKTPGMSYTAEERRKIFEEMENEEGPI